MEEPPPGAGFATAPIDQVFPIGLYQAQAISTVALRCFTQLLHWRSSVTIAKLKAELEELHDN